MKKQAPTAAFISTLIVITLAGSLLVGLVNANIIIIKRPNDSFGALYSMRSPQNKTYNVDTVSLTFTVKTVSYPDGYSYFYILDGQDDMRVDEARVDLMPVKVTSEMVVPLVGPTLDPQRVYTLEFDVTLSSLSEGSHSLIIGNAYPAGSDWDNPYVSSLSPEVYFSVDAPPKISVLSPVDKNQYNASDVPLIFTVNKPISSAAYSLNYSASVAVNGNTTLSLSNGTYNIIIYATDATGKTGISQTVIFTVAQPQISTLSAWIPLVVAALILVVAVAIGLLLLFSRRCKPKG